MEQEHKMVFSENINEQLKHDAPFAWFLRHHGCQSPIFRLDDIKRLDDRLNSFLQAFYVSEERGISLASTLRLDDWGARFVLFWLGIESGKSEYCIEATKDIEDQEESNELAEALSWFVQLDKIESMLKTLGDTPHTNPWVKRAAIDACRLNSISLTDNYIRGVLASDDSINQVAILDYIASQRLDYSDIVISLFSHDDEAVRLSALIAGIYQPQSISELFSCLQPLVLKDTFQLKLAIKHTFVLANINEARKLVCDINSCDYSERIKIYAKALSGLVDFLPELIELTKDKDLAKVAGEAISMITGLDLEEDDFSLPLGDYAMREIGNDDFDDELEKDFWKSAYEDDLPLPDAEALMQWWDKNQGDFNNTVRYLAGVPIDIENMKSILTTGNQIQREMAALHLAYLDKTQKIFQVNSNADRQYHQLTLVNMNSNETN
ncbi:MAG: hypothetical protein KGV46_00110 [Pasteurella sp.]|nr:hypothetical protein [Pasteurella sp.]